MPITVFPETCYHMQQDLGISLSILVLCTYDINFINMEPCVLMMFAIDSVVRGRHICKPIKY